MELLLRRELSFYSYFESQARVAVDSAKEFYEISLGQGLLQSKIDRLQELEHEGDNITHAVQKKVHETFITPLDKEDLLNLTSALDDITDLVEAAAARVDLYGLTTMRPDLAPLVATLVKSTELVAQTMALLAKGIHRPAKIEANLTEIHTAENESDKLFRQALKDLFTAPNPDPLELIKWKEMYDRVEVAVDKCEEIAKIVSMILTKYS